jgi:hypothetical protein
MTGSAEMGVPPTVPLSNGAAESTLVFDVVGAVNATNSKVLIRDTAATNELLRVKELVIVGHSFTALEPPKVWLRALEARVVAQQVLSVLFRRTVKG